MTFDKIVLWMVFISTIVFSIRAIAQNYDIKNEKPYYIKGFNIFLVLKSFFLCLGILLFIVTNNLPMICIGLAPFFLVRMVEIAIYNYEK